MEPQLVTKPAFTVVGMLLRATPMSPEIPQLWGRFAPRMDEIPNLAEPHVSYGVMGNYDTATSQFDYLAGCSVTTVGAMPEGMSRWDVPAQIYAVFETTIPAMGQTMDAIYTHWLPTSGYRQVNSMYFERYGETFSPEDPASTLSIYIPVEKQA
ncbi:MAG: GyrI-like domain-containing protein [Caldilinea sp.]|nr:GyrI-like domain-containing protein [Caldilinea sp.]MCB0056640.1 GyrI-like domain-containing protein [Caldilineaceae bacterium]MCB0039089.1 GyrI-like domain-containing protein [Caldilinea sp.]MCB0137364.1 GyrI-like domain-containing protein [Caldilineaceae bacterium]MCB9122281.1 GyrI-like domain-containing protein [Caldilineaceae bacterium]